MPTPDPNQPTNRIDVDLKLMAENDLKRMEDIFSKFGDSISKLETIVKSFTGQVLAAQNAVQQGGAPGGGSKSGGPLAPHPLPTLAHTARDDYEMNRREKFIKTMGEQNLGLPGRMAGWGGYIQHGQALTDAEREVFATNRFERYTFQDIMRIMSNWAGEMSIDDKGQVRPGRMGMARVAAGTGFIAQEMPRVHGLRDLVGRMANTARTPYNVGRFGQQVGYSPYGVGIGPFQTGLFSPAFRQTLGTYWDSLKNSWFGLNPMYSTAQSNEATSVTQGFGYTGAVADQWRNALKNIEIDTGLPSGITGPMMDKATRFGGMSIDAFNQAMLDVPKAAQAARMNVEQFVSDLDAAATTLAESTNMTYGTALGSVSAVSAATGLAPQSAAAPMNDQLYQMMRISMNGGNVYKATMGSYQGTQNLTILSHMLASMGVPGGLAGMRGLQKRDPKKFGEIANTIASVEMSPQGKELLGGYSLKDILTMGERGNVIGNTKAAEAMRVAQNAIKSGATVASVNKGATSLHSIMTDLGLSAANQAKITAMNKSMADQGHPVSYSDQLKQLRDYLSKRERAGAEGARHRVMLDLTPSAQQLVYVLNKGDTNSARYSYGNPGGGKYPSANNMANNLAR